MRRLALSAAGAVGIAFLLGCGFPTSGISGGGAGGMEATTSGGGGVPATTGSMSTGTSSSTGLPASCTKNADCGAATACSTPACTGSVCIAMNQPDGTVVIDGSPTNDCKKTVCMGGKTAQAPDDTENPDDMNPCTSDRCQSGVAQHTPTMDGTPCGRSGSCLSGACNGCSDPAECPQGDACNVATCTAGVCGIDSASQNGQTCMPSTGPCLDDAVCVAGACPAKPKAPGKYSDGMDGNCQGISCDGAGNPSPAQDPNDVPPDDDPSDCTVPNCSNGNPGIIGLNNGSACGPNGTDKCASGVCCVDGPACGQSCCSSGESCTFQGCCAASNVCNNFCCSSNHTCLNNFCCPDNKVCVNNTVCCGIGQTCKMNDTCGP
jgi:hypothetical protein